MLVRMRRRYFLAECFDVDAFTEIDPDHVDRIDDRSAFLGSDVSEREEVRILLPIEEHADVVRLDSLVECLDRHVDPLLELIAGEDKGIGPAIWTADPPAEDISAVV